MFKHLAIGTAVLASALAILPTAAHAQQPYYGNAYGYSYGNAYQDGYVSGDGYGRDRYYDHEARERHEYWERMRERREHERWERSRRYHDDRYRDDRGYDNGYSR